MNLVVGATGVLGGEICRHLVERGRPVRAMVRDSSDPDRVARLRGIGAEVVRGDLKDPRSLEAACRGVRTVVSTAASVHSRQEGDSFDSVDRQGHLSLIDAAEAAGVGQFVHVAFPPVAVEFPLPKTTHLARTLPANASVAVPNIHPTFRA